MTKIALMMIAGATVSTAALADNSTMSRDEVRSLVAEMMSDAETRSSLLQGGGMAGYDGGFKVGSADGNWSMKVNGLIQFRYIANFRDDGEIGADEDDFTNGFQTRKTRVTFSGNAVNPNLTYFIALENVGVGSRSFEDTDNDPNTPDELVSTDASGGWNANDIYFGYNMENGWKIRGGQYKIGFLKEELISERNTLAIERGVMNAVFNQGRSQGVGFTYESNDWRWAFDFTDGFRSANTDIADSGEAEYALTARGEWKWAGEWSALSDFTSKPGDASSGAVGFAAHWQQSTQSGAPADVDTDTWALTVDAQWESNGWSAFGAFVYNSSDTNAAGAPSVDNMGATIQVGYRWNETSEVFAKWDGIFLDDDGGTDPAFDDDIHFITAGYNHYFAGNAAKLSVDVIYAISETQNLVGSGGTLAGGSTDLGILGQGDGGEMALRAQFQLAF